MSTDTLFYLHTLENITDSLPIANGLYLNGDFTAIKQFMTEGNSIKGRIRFFLGYSGWEPGQLKKEIEENTWLVDKADIPSLMDEKACKTCGKMHLANLAENTNVVTFSANPYFELTVTGQSSDYLPSSTRPTLSRRIHCIKTTSLNLPPANHHSFSSPHCTKPQEPNKRKLASLSAATCTTNCFRNKKPKA